MARRPSTEKQLDLSRLLVEELRAIGLDDAVLNEGRAVFATLPGTVDGPTIGLVAHVDTSPDVLGAGVLTDRARGVGRRADHPPGRLAPGPRPRDSAGTRGARGPRRSSRRTARRCLGPTTRPAWLSSCRRPRITARTSRDRHMARFDFASPATKRSATASIISISRRARGGLRLHARRRRAGDGRQRNVFRRPGDRDGDRGQHSSASIGKGKMVNALRIMRRNS